jgi:hypothetical protein
VGVLGLCELTTQLNSMLSCGLEIGRVENAEGLIDRVTALRDKMAQPAPSATKSRMAVTPSISKAMWGRMPTVAISDSTSIRMALGRLGMTKGSLETSLNSIGGGGGSS